MIRRSVLAVLVALGSLAVASPAFAVDPPLDDARQVDGGELHTCAVTSDNKALCWGDSTYGQVGFGPSGDVGTAVPVFAVDGTGFLSSVRQVTAGGQHSCAVLLNNQARCWGDNTHGQLGSGGPSIDHAAVVLNGPGTGPLTGVRSISAGSKHTCALLVSGQVRCWGFNNGGQLGDGTTTGRPRPVGVRSTNGIAPLTDAVQLSVGAHHACVRLSNGQARCWGVGEHGRIGDGTQIDRKRAVVVRNETGSAPLSGVRQLAVGVESVCAVLTSGQVRCWGKNLNFQIGDGTQQDRFRPTVVRTDASGFPALAGVSRVAAGGFHACAVLTNGQARCWGEGTLGRLGTGLADNEPYAASVVAPGACCTIRNVTALSAGGTSSCARLANGQLRCWGHNEYGQVGDATNDDRFYPVAVTEG